VVNVPLKLRSTFLQWQLIFVFVNFISYAIGLGLSAPGTVVSYCVILFLHQLLLDVVISVSCVWVFRKRMVSVINILSRSTYDMYVSYVLWRSALVAIAVFFQFHFS